MHGYNPWVAICSLNLCTGPRAVYIDSTFSGFQFHIGRDRPLITGGLTCRLSLTACGRTLRLSFIAHHFIPSEQPDV